MSINLNQGEAEGMRIRLETSKGHGIDNYQEVDGQLRHKRFNRDIESKHRAAIPRTKESLTYNCHGLVFAARRTRIEKSHCIRQILEEDCYKEIGLKDVLPGDIVIYYSDGGEPEHSGIIVECPKSKEVMIPFVCSKWGSYGEFVHALHDKPSEYGSNVRYFRCRL